MGCSGWNYADWRGVLYPPGCPQRKLLARYAEVYGHRGRRGNYSPSELDEWARELRRLARRAEVFAYLNNDWEGFAVRNARGLMERLSG